MDIFASIESDLSHTDAPAPSQALDRLLVGLQAVAPRLTPKDASDWATALTPAMLKGEITTPRRRAALLGQLAVESEHFTETVEDLNYSAARLCQVWPYRFRTIAVANPYAMKPEALANLIYAGRDGNGNQASGDGWRFRGGGLIQLTFRANYSAFAEAHGMTPEAAAAWVQTTKDGAATSACWFWTQHHLNDDADSWNIDGITRIINGGFLGAANREFYADAALKALGGT